MTVVFCGHRDVVFSVELKENLEIILSDLIKNGADIFLLGGYGNFDIGAVQTIGGLKNKYPKIKAVLVISYLNQKYNRVLYDEIIYPDLESVPKRYAIVKRNRWTVQHADMVVAYVEHSWGGAAKTMEYAQRQGIEVMNIAKIYKKDSFAR